jgi:hypothetical protein
LGKQVKPPTTPVPNPALNAALDRFKQVFERAKATA